MKIKVIGQIKLKPIAKEPVLNKMLKINIGLKYLTMMMLNSHIIVYWTLYQDFTNLAIKTCWPNTQINSLKKLVKYSRRKVDLLLKVYSIICIQELIYLMDLSRNTEIYCKKYKQKQLIMSISSISLKMLLKI